MPVPVAGLLLLLQRPLTRRCYEWGTPKSESFGRHVAFETWFEDEHWLVPYVDGTCEQKAKKILSLCLDSAGKAPVFLSFI